MFNSQTTRMPNGVTNAAPWQTLGAAGFPDPTFAQVYAEDFNTFTAGDFTFTAVGTPTQALTAAAGGQLRLTNTTGSTDACYAQLVTAGFQLTPGTDSFFKFKGKASIVANGTVYAGLIATSTTPLAASDGLFVKAVAGVLTLVSVVGGTTPSVAFPTSEVLVAATDFEIGIHVDYLGNVEAFFNPSTGANQPSTSVPRGRSCALYAPGVTQALLAPSFGILNGAGTARTLDVDYVVAAVER